jgi:hypothetical protein
MNDKQRYQPRGRDIALSNPLPFREAPIPSEPQQFTDEQGEQGEQDEAQRKLREQEVESQEDVLRQDSYRDTEGSSYGPSRSGSGEPQGGKGPAEQSDDPAHSGVQPAKHKPGETVNAPRCETKTAWGEDQQMGYTDTPDRRNPAG